MKLIIAVALAASNLISCSTILSERESGSSSGFGSSFIKYDGRFSKIEPVRGYDNFDALKAMVKCKLPTLIKVYKLSSLDNNSISIPGAPKTCGIICKLKAASLSVIVPSRASEEARIPNFDHYWLKLKLLKDLSELPAETFTENRNVFDAAMKMIDYHLFYRIEEYRRFTEEIMEKYPIMGEVHEHEITERAWNLILKPVHLILNKIIKGVGKDLQVDASFIAELVKLISSPVEEESKMVSSLINYVLFNQNSVSARVVLSAINEFLNKALSGEIPMVSIDPILRFFGDAMFQCSKDPESAVTMRLLAILRTRILPLHGNSKFFWIQEGYTHAILEYFIFFQIGERKTIKRTPFEPIFPLESPFQDSEEVSLIRRALMRRSHGHDQSKRLNQMAKFDVMFKLTLYQFYPRSMLIDIFESLRLDFVENLCIESAFHIYALITKNELFIPGDEVSKFIRDRLLSMTDNFVQCQRQGHELGNICGALVNQIDLIKYHDSPKQIENEMKKITSILVS